MSWHPIIEYQPAMGRVVVRLEWLQYAGQGMGKSDDWLAAYTIATISGPVWVDAKDCIPIETTGRRVTHFSIPAHWDVPPKEATK